MTDILFNEKAIAFIFRHKTFTAGETQILRCYFEEIQRFHFTHHNYNIVTHLFRYRRQVALSGEAVEFANAVAEAIQFSYCEHSRKIINRATLVRLCGAADFRTPEFDLFEESQLTHATVHLKPESPSNWPNPLFFMTIVSHNLWHLMTEPNPEESEEDNRVPDCSVM